MLKTPPPDFEIHVDPSCLADNAESHTKMSTERNASNDSSQTVVHHESWTEDELKNEIPPTNEHNSDDTMKNGANDEEEDMPTPAGVETEENNMAPESEEVVHEQDEQPELEEPSVLDSTISESEREQEELSRQIEKMEAEIKAAARAVVANIQNDHNEENDDSILSAQTDESYDYTETELSHEGTETIHDDEEDSFISDRDAVSERHSDMEGGDSSSHHDGDVDDDVFSSSDHSKRSSLNSLHSSDGNQKLLTSPAVGEEAASANDEETISRMPSMSSYIHTPIASEDQRTPSKVLSRPPFRTPSSVRAMQMSSPTASLFSSPRSTKRHLPTVSRIGTPNSQYSPSKRTPTRLKPRKAAPLVLLHVTVMPLQWPYSHLMSLPDIPESLQEVKQSWNLLQDKIGETVFERGILLSHPQESYEVLEERLYEALELPVRPRARILKCGHYMGPLDSEAPSSDEENDYFEAAEIRDGRKWCDICGRDVRVEEVGDLPRGEKRFTVKIYASNGLMRAGAWEAAWREMERVDVELEPYVDTSLRVELEHLLAITPREPIEDHDDGFEDEEVIEHVHDHSSDQDRQVEEARVREKEEMIARMAKEEATQQRMAEEDEMKNLLAEEEELKQRMAEEDAMRHHIKEQETLRQNEEKMRQMYEQEAERSESRRTSSRSSVHDDSSFVELLMAAFKVVLRDSRNIAIGVLSLAVLLLALSARPTNHTLPMIMENASVSQVTTTVFKDAPVASAENVQSAIDSAPGSQVTTTVVREYTVTEKVPVATSSEDIEVASSVAETQVTTTVFREKTVTELVPVPSSVVRGIDPCESDVAAPAKAEPVMRGEQVTENIDDVVFEPEIEASPEEPAKRILETMLESSTND